MTPAAILAATFTIAFEGLMMFQTEANGYRNVAIVDATNAGHNTPKIEIWSPPFNNAPPPIDLVSGDLIRFDGVPRGKITRDDLYGRHVPHIRNYIVTGDIDTNVVNKAPRPGHGLAFVDLPGGAMTTFEGFRDPARLTSPFSGDQKLCFARFVVMQTEYLKGTQLVVKRGGNDMRYDVHENDVVIVSNISTQRHSHFYLYGRLLAPGGVLGEAEVLENEKPSCSGEASPDTPASVKAFLLNLYSRLPNGDCGALGNP
jgi:hypothetical protein